MASVLHLRRRYAIVQVHTLPDVLVFAAAVPKLMGARVILDMHELTPEFYASKFGNDDGFVIRLIATLERLSASFAHRVLTVSKPTWKVLIERGIPPSKLEIVMNTPDERIFSIDPIPRSQHRERSSE